jgi:hypothetical protein
VKTNFLSGGNTWETMCPTGGGCTYTSPFFGGVGSVVFDSVANYLYFFAANSYAEAIFKTNLFSGGSDWITACDHISCTYDFQFGSLNMLDFDSNTGNIYGDSFRFDYQN